MSHVMKIVIDGELVMEKEEIVCKMHFISGVE